MWTDSQIEVAVISVSLLLFILIVVIICLVIQCNESFRKGVKWAEENTLCNSLTFILDKGLSKDYKEFEYQRMLKKHKGL